MKIHIILFCCLSNTLAVTVNYETTEKANGRYYKQSLKDIRLVSVKNSENFQQSDLREGQDENLKYRTALQPEVTPQSLTKSEAERKKFDVISRAGIGDSFTSSSDEQAQMQKIANQLYLAQKRASLLSEHQKYIISQDKNVKNFVFGQSVQTRVPKPFSTTRPRGRSLSVQPKVKYVTVDSTTAGSVDSGKFVTLTSKIQTAPKKISNDHKAQGTHIKYVTLAPQPLTHFVGSRDPNEQMTLPPYQTPQPFNFYHLKPTGKSQVETVQIPTTVSLGLGSHAFQQPQYHQEENGHDDGLENDDSKYEFMYKVKDYEKESHFGHKESRTDKTTYGYYFVHLPDGRLETVKYWADKSGYHAKVDYVGQAKHPPQKDYKLNSHNLVYQ